MWLLATEKCDICETVWIACIGDGDGPEFPVEEEDALGTECPKCHNMTGYPIEENEIEEIDSWDE